MNDQSPMQARAVLAPDHTGARVNYQGLLQQSQNGLRREPGLAEMLRQLMEHLTEMGQRFYAGDVTAVDEFLQLYCIERETRAALASHPQPQPTVKESLTPQQPASAVPDEREAFEAWAGKYPGLEDDEGYVNLRYLGIHGQYVDFDVQRAWTAWQARAQLAARPAVPIMTRDDVQGLLAQADYLNPGIPHTSRADFVNGARHAERHCAAAWGVKLAGAAGEGGAA